MKEDTTVTQCGINMMYSSSKFLKLYGSGCLTCNSITSLLHHSGLGCVTALYLIPCPAFLYILSASWVSLVRPQKKT